MSAFVPSTNWVLIFPRQLLVVKAHSTTLSPATPTMLPMAANDKANAKALPAHDTKHLPLLVYPFRDNIVFELAQSDDGANNGTALWLGAQILSAFLTDTLRSPCIHSADRALTAVSSSILSSTRWTRKPRAIELGSGVGLTALVLAAQGWSILATDTPAVVHSALGPNILRNTQNMHFLGTVQIRALDWTVPPEGWVWNDPLSIAGPSLDDERKKESGGEEELLRPPFDLILTSDTVYSPELTAPLLRTLKHLILLSSPLLSTPTSDSRANSNEKQKKSHPPVYLALEARDPAQIASFFSQARDVWGLNAQRVPAPRVRRAMSHAGLGKWKREDWEGVEVWRMHLLDTESDMSVRSI